jgi:hypothetical protein
MNDSAPATSSPPADRSGARVLLALRPDHQRPVEQSYRACTVSFSLADAPLAELEQLAVSAGATLYEVLLAAFQALAARHSGSDDIILGSPNAVRGSAQLEALTGSVVPVDPAVSQLRPRRSLSHNPVFQVVFAFHEEDRPVALPGEVEKKFAELMDEVDLGSMIAEQAGETRG